MNKNINKLFSKTQLRHSFGQESYTKQVWGFTILETIIALGILTAAVIGPVALISHALWSASTAKDDIIASNLAQEGLELIHAIRDDNILCDHIDGTPDNNVPDWRKDPSGGPFINAQYEIDSNMGVGSSIPCGTKSIPNVPRPSFGCGGAYLRKDANGVYNYATGVQTLFARCIKITSGLSIVNPDSSIPPDDQMDVQVTVSWQERSTPKSIVLTERLYNWR